MEGAISVEEKCKLNDGETEHRGRRGRRGVSPQTVNCRVRGLRWLHYEGEGWGVGEEGVGGGEPTVWGASAVMGGAPSAV